MVICGVLDALETSGKLQGRKPETKTCLLISDIHLWLQTLTFVVHLVFVLCAAGFILVSDYLLQDNPSLTSNSSRRRRQPFVKCFFPPWNPTAETHPDWCDEGRGWASLSGQSCSRVTPWRHRSLYCWLGHPEKIRCLLNKCLLFCSCLVSERSWKSNVLRFCLKPMNDLVLSFRTKQSHGNSRVHMWEFLLSGAPGVELTPRLSEGHQQLQFKHLLPVSCILLGESCLFTFAQVRLTNMESPHADLMLERL